MDHLCDLTKSVKECGHTSNMRLHRTKCSGLIKNILFPHFKADLQNDIGDGNFSVLIDESADISVTKLLAVCVIYFSQTKFCIVSTFLGMVELEEGNEMCIRDRVGRGRALKQGRHFQIMVLMT